MGKKSEYGAGLNQDYLDNPEENADYYEDKLMKKLEAKKKKKKDTGWTNDMLEEGPGSSDSPNSTGSKAWSLADKITHGLRNIKAANDSKKEKAKNAGGR